MQESFVDPKPWKSLAFIPLLSAEFPRITEHCCKKRSDCDDLVNCSPGCRGRLSWQRGLTWARAEWSLGSAGLGFHLWGSLGYKADDPVKLASGVPSFGLLFLLQGSRVATLDPRRWVALLPHCSHLGPLFLVSVQGGSFVAVAFLSSVALHLNSSSWNTDLIHHFVGYQWSPLLVLWYDTRCHKGDSSQSSRLPAGVR